MNFLKLLPLLLISTSLFSQGSLDSGLVAYYPLNGNVDDASVSAAHGVLENAVGATDQFNTANNAYQFQYSANTRIKIPYSQKLDITPTQMFSSSFWVYANSYPSTTNGTLLYYGSLYASNYSVVLMSNSTADSGKINVVNYKGSNTPPYLVNIKSGTRLQKNTWYFIALTIDGTSGASETKLYINNVLSAQSNNSVIIPSSQAASANTNSSILNIGNHADVDWGFTGKIDEVRLYGRILTAQELQDLYSNFTGIHDNSSAAVQQLTVYPNPSGHGLNMTNPFDTESEMVVYDYTGREVLKTTLTDHLKLDVSFWAQGVYSIRVRNNQQELATKFIRE